MNEYINGNLLYFVRLTKEKHMQCYYKGLPSEEPRKQEPTYLTTEETIIHHNYNPNYGDERVCKCGHSYYRHFDTFDEMNSVGCKYCPCNNFVENI